MAADYSQASTQPPTTCIILAAGKGSRMGHELPKPLVPFMGKPMAAWTVEAARELNGPIVIVENAQHSISMSQSFPDVQYVVQNSPNGPADAVRATLDMITTDTVTILLGDTPLISAATLQALIQCHYAQKSKLTLLAGTSDTQTPFSVLVRDAGGNVASLSLTAKPSGVTEYSLGPLVIDTIALRKHMQELLDSQGPEKRLEPLVALFAQRGYAVQSYQIPFITDVLWGINTPDELRRAEEYFRIHLS